MKDIENEVLTVEIVASDVADLKGRPLPQYLTDRALLEEIVIGQRQFADLVEQFMSSMEKNPMMKMFAGKMMG